ncbi:MAG: hypothetical protein H2069_08705 [Legionella sp.]|nr:hypothetical protein [Legionella sp.]
MKSLAPLDESLLKSNTQSMANLERRLTELATQLKNAFNEQRLSAEAAINDAVRQLKEAESEMHQYQRGKENLQREHARNDPNKQLSRLSNIHNQLTCVSDMIQNNMVSQEELPPGYLAKLDQTPIFAEMVKDAERAVYIQHNEAYFIEQRLAVQNAQIGFLRAHIKNKEAVLINLTQNYQTYMHTLNCLRESLLSCRKSHVEGCGHFVAIFGKEPQSIPEDDYCIQIVKNAYSDLIKRSLELTTIENELDKVQNLCSSVFKLEDTIREASLTESIVEENIQPPSETSSPSRLLMQSPHSLFYVNREGSFTPNGSSPRPSKSEDNADAANAFANIEPVESFLDFQMGNKKIYHSGPNTPASGNNPQTETQDAETYKAHLDFLMNG